MCGLYSLTTLIDMVRRPSRRTHWLPISSALLYLTVQGSSFAKSRFSHCGVIINRDTILVPISGVGWARDLISKSCESVVETKRG
jgi:hypothetical protein